MSVMCCACTVCVKDRDLHGQKYWYDNFISIFSWLAWLILQPLKLKKIWHNLEKTSWAALAGHKHGAVMNTGMSSWCDYRHVHASACAYLHNPWHTVYVFSLLYIFDVFTYYGCWLCYYKLYRGNHSKSVAKIVCCLKL